ncbi:hypothetical protein M011DRAFT_467053 [Sporormia fimetaria CBS 119925]|uniref:Uncharacterized protein n=1 Tax=Sporormia fimetaria CBS 119925 TaxID=1340428 RepID=A0A6A6VE54_9PLEO|nr:hypothetical protein M011DRAFT_467053 [Sporormia fimetaria CBS 119925]
MSSTTGQRVFREVDAGDGTPHSPPCKYAANVPEVYSRHLALDHPGAPRTNGGYGPAAATPAVNDNTAPSGNARHNTSAQDHDPAANTASIGKSFPLHECDPTNIATGLGDVRNMGSLIDRLVNESRAHGVRNPNRFVHTVLGLLEQYRLIPDDLIREMTEQGGFMPPEGIDQAFNFSTEDRLWEETIGMDDQEPDEAGGFGPPRDVNTAFYFSADDPEWDQVMGRAGSEESDGSDGSEDSETRSLLTSTTLSPQRDLPTPPHQVVITNDVGAHIDLTTPPPGTVEHLNGVDALLQAAIAEADQEDAASRTRIDNSPDPNDLSDLRAHISQVIGPNRQLVTPPESQEKHTVATIEMGPLDAPGRRVVTPEETGRSDPTPLDPIHLEDDDEYPSTLSLTRDEGKDEAGRQRIDSAHSSVTGDTAPTSSAAHKSTKRSREDDDDEVDVTFGRVVKRERVE